MIKIYLASLLSPLKGLYTTHSIYKFLARVLYPIPSFSSREARSDFRVKWLDPGSYQLKFFCLRCLSWARLPPAILPPREAQWTGDSGPSPPITSPLVAYRAQPAAIPTWIHVKYIRCLYVAETARLSLCKC